MLTHHTTYPPSVITSTERLMNQHDSSGDPMNSARYSSRQQQQSIPISRPGTLFPGGFPPPSVSYLANTSSNSNNDPGHLGRLPHIPYPVEMTTTSTTPTTSASAQKHQNSLPSPTFVIPSPPASFPSPISFRYDVVLEAPPAAAHRTEDSPLTYLNKGQFYTINLVDMDGYDGVVTSTLTIMFHEESHRRLAGNYWRFWLGQQKDPQTSRAIDINASRCSGIQNIQSTEFDRITFDWNGRHGASIRVQFNCLSTDFSRIKGVKGIPLRLHMESSQAHSSYGAAAGLAQQQQHIEAAYCKIKLFRDKGAERKNKDNTRQLERQLRKLRGKHEEAHSLWITYHRAQSYTVFSEIPECLSPATPIIQDASPMLKSTSSLSVMSSPSLLLHSHVSSLVSTPGNSATGMVPSTIVNTPSTPPRGTKRSATMMQQHQQDYFGHSSTRGLLMCDIDPSYTPLPKRRVAKLSFFARFPSSEFHRAVYLEELSVKDLVAKVASKVPLAGPVQNVIREVFRKDSNSIISVRVDDAMVQDIPEEQDMDIDTKMDEDGMMTLVLRY